MRNSHHISHLLHNIFSTLDGLSKIQLFTDFSWMGEFARTMCWMLVSLLSTHPLLVKCDMELRAGIRDEQGFYFIQWEKRRVTTDQSEARKWSLVGTANVSSKFPVSPQYNITLNYYSWPWDYLLRWCKEKFTG